ncbi:MAG TPA: hypothetical protein VIJ94_15150 [Caulobacteraceae bacterium]
MTVTWDSTLLEAKLREACYRGVVAGVEMVLTEGTRLILSPPKTGKIYVRRGIKHQASAPGEPPASDTGRLAGSANAIYPNQADLFQVIGYANWSTIYARPLELGSENVDPRPFARPALDSCTPAIQGGIAAEVKAAFS